MGLKPKAVARVNGKTVIIPFPAGDEVAVAPPLPMLPHEPTGVTASAGLFDVSVNLAWTDASTNETGFYVYRNTTNTSTGATLIATLAAGSTTYTDNDDNSGANAPAEGTTYYYWVSSYNLAGESAKSPAASNGTGGVTTIWMVPAAPTSLSATAVSSSQINLAWTDNSNNETGFEIFRSTDGITFSSLATVGAGVTTYNNTGLTASTQYYYKVWAFNPGESSSYSNTANATTQSGTTTYNVEYLVIAGGGGGGSATGGGGGAGGYRAATGFSLTPGTSYTVTVGAGGGNNGNGTNSVFSTVTSTGGGRGGFAATAADKVGGNGGSGGGGSGWTSDVGGTATTGQGNNGGTGGGASYGGGGGGGGANAAGANGGGNGTAAGSTGGAGGNGTSSSITGSSVTRAGGGGGGVFDSTGTRGLGGSGGGGNGGANAVGSSGSVNTGSGGGGGVGGGGSGGSGVVILRMATANYSGTTTGSPTVTTSGSDTILTFTASGSYSA